jgi:hypothetical protein
MTRISDSEIRLKVLESKEFAYAAGEQLRDELTNEQAAMIGYYIFTGGGNDKLLPYLLDILCPIMSKVLDSEIEDYKDKHSLNDEMDDCSAFKNHREENPELYK